MNIIICGAGRVGFTIAKLLSEQGHSITVIDQSSEDIQKINDSLDVKAIVGKATYPSILEKANAPETDMKMLHKGNLVIKTKIPNAGLLFISNRMLLPENINYLKKFVSTSKMTWVVSVSEIFTEFLDLDPVCDIEILKMSIAQNAYILNKKVNDWKLARSMTEVAFLLKEGINCIWCPSDLFKFSKKDVFLNKEFALSMACKLTKGLLMKKVYLFQQDKLSDELTEEMRSKGLAIEYCF